MNQPPENHRWTLLTGPSRAMDNLRQAAKDAGFIMKPVAEDHVHVHVHVPRSIRKRRRSAELTGTLSATTKGAEVLWICQGGTASCQQHLLALEQHLPAGTVDYHGLIEAAARVGLPRPTVRNLRGIAEILRHSETVHAAGHGRYEDQDGYVILTNQRLLMASPTGNGIDMPLDVCLGTIEKISLGKRRTGEVLMILGPDAALEVTGLGHGEGHGITKAHWQAVHNPDRAETVTE